MDIVIEFFRDTLDGPFYIVWVVVLVILIFACIGYLAEKGIKNKKEKEKYATVSETNNTDVSQDTVVSEPVSTTQVTSTLITTPVDEPVSIDTPSTSGEVTPTVSEVTTAPVEDASSSVVQPVEVTQPNDNVVTSSVVSAQVEPTTNVVNSPSNEVNNVVIPTINQDGNDNTV